MSDLPNRKKLIWIAPYLPYREVAHAGGKNFYYYFNSLVNAELFDICLITFYSSNELDHFDFGDKIECKLFSDAQTGIKRFFRRLLNAGRKFNPFDKYARFVSKYSEVNILKALKQYKRTGRKPDIIVLHWTQIVLLADRVKKVFPHAKIVSIEEDVTLLSFKRQIELEQSKSEKKRAIRRFHYMEKGEIDSLNLSDLVIVNNPKDLDLLLQYKVPREKMRQWSVYFENYAAAVPVQKATDVLFYGAMNRKENYLSAQWLLEKVRPLVKDAGLKFVIVGGNPHPSILKYNGGDVAVTGFVKDVTPYFENSLCLAAPLVLGAGIKVKILEAFSAGLPVLTNEIGIEGIPAKRGEDFFFCKSAEEYAAAILTLAKDSALRIRMGERTKTLIAENFNCERDAEQFRNWLLNLFDV